MTIATIDEAVAIYQQDCDGIFTPNAPVHHRDEEYEAAHFEMLLDMQERHFWYRGRHRFLLHGVTRHMRNQFGDDRPIDAVDLGGGCGGWIKYLNSRAETRFADLALADSSRRALQLAAPVVGGQVRRYQIDLMDLQWRERWDAAFLLDVLEHIPEDADALRQIRQSLRPGGLLFVTTPALNFFWSYNDELVHHVRRYSKPDFRRLAQETGFELCDARYFMTLLSPLLLLSRLKRPDVENMSLDDINEHQRRTHQVPIAPINALLRGVFSLETPIGHWLPFPWGTSIFGVFRRPTTCS
jgi:2-polyprenyl-3-methyl-5-hydroxy-6-metoxy-1,4-benzoquinol methylase